MDMQQELSGIIKSIYATALSDDNWDSLLAQVADYFASNMATYMVQSDKTGFGQRHHIYGIDNSLMNSYEEYYGPRSTLFDQFRDIDVGKVLTDGMSPNYDVYLKSETYNDFCHRNAIEHALTIFSDRNRDWVDVLILRRTQKKGHYNNDEIASMQLLSPHFVQAAAMSKLTKNKNALGAAYEQVFNQLSVGVFIVDNSHNVVFVNDLADKIFSDDDGLSLLDGRLKASDAKEHKTLQQSLTRTLEIIGGSQILAMPPVQVSRSNPKNRPYQVAYMPLVNEALPLANGSDLLLATIYDPETQVVSSIQVLCALYGLTSAEGLVTQAICNGNSVKEVAGMLGVSQNAVRFHLKNIFQKLHVKRQTEMVRMVLSGPASILIGP